MPHTQELDSLSSADVDDRQLEFTTGNLRTGKWTKEEEDLTKELIKQFKLGTLEDCPDRYTLRSYLAAKLKCNPMRISKKLAGLRMGKSAFRKISSDDPPATREISSDLMNQLERSVKDGVKEKSIGLKRSQPSSSSSSSRSKCKSKASSSSSSSDASDLEDGDYEDEEEDEEEDEVFDTRHTGPPIKGTLASDLPAHVCSSTVNLAGLFHTDEPFTWWKSTKRQRSDRGAKDGKKDNKAASYIYYDDFHEMVDGISFFTAG